MLAITLGDPFSINIELLSGVGLGAGDTPIVIIGSWEQWSRQRKTLQSSDLAVELIDRDQSPKDGLSFFDTGSFGPLDPTQMTAKERGQHAVAALDALRLPVFRHVQSVLTMPIDKSAACIAGFDFPGQTEFFEHLWQGQAVMILAGEKLKVALVTNHLALKDVSQRITSELITEKCRLFHQTLRQVYGIQSPRLAVTGLNPHAGDQGLFGDEESQTILPAINRLRESGLDVSGPLPADTAFAFAYRGKFDGVLAMYHDQGLGPLKLVHFDDAVNISGGLSLLRVSPDHGPARDLFMQKKASLASTKAALNIALTTCSSRTASY